MLIHANSLMKASAFIPLIFDYFIIIKIEKYFNTNTRICIILMHSHTSMPINMGRIIIISDRNGDMAWIILPST